VSQTALNRRTLLRGLIAGAAAIPARPASAQVSFRVGLVIPAGPLAESVVQGAELGLADAGALAALFGKHIELVRETGATTGSELRAGLRLVRQEGALALVGGVDDGSAEALRDAAAQAGALFFNVGALSDRLRGERCARQALHVMPSRAMHVGAVGQWLVEGRKLRRWALLTSDSAPGRETEEDATAFLAPRGGTIVARERVPPGMADWQPALQRLRGIAPEVVFVGLAPGDLLPFIRQYRAGGLPAQLAGIAADPTPLLGAQPDELTGVWPLAWHHDLDRFSARELNSKFRRRFRRPLDGPAWAAWAALKLIGEGLVRGEATDAPGLLRFVERAPPFDGHKGQPLIFQAWDHQLRQPMYLASPRPAERREGKVGALEVIAEVPRGSLDQISPSRGESRCRFES
jgi:branched-chain amino acid transport system substrate-binding protein